MRPFWRLHYPLSGAPRQAQMQQPQMDLLIPARRLSLLQGQASSKHDILYLLSCLRNFTTLLIWNIVSLH